MEEIINSVMQSPENTNPNVLRSQLQSIGGDSVGTFIATIMENGSEVTSDKSKSEILGAFNSGKTVFASVPQYGVLIPLTATNIARFEMSSIQTPGMESITSVYYLVIEVAENKSCTFLVKSISFDDE